MLTLLSIYSRYKLTSDRITCAVCGPEAVIVDCKVDNSGNVGQSDGAWLVRENVIFRYGKTIRQVPQAAFV